MYFTLRRFRSGIGLACLFVILFTAATLVVLSVPDHMTRIVGGTILAVGVVALAIRTLLDIRHRRTTGGS